jgi:aryl-alcohol dehydrogenase-like predicted oxidoreductase
MEYRLLGASGLEVSVLSFGTMTLGGEGRFAAMGNVQTEEARRQIEICIEAGVNLFDTADIYSFGKWEEVLGRTSVECGFRRMPLFFWLILRLY